MNRRDFLAGSFAGGGLMSGCLSLPSDRSASTPHSRISITTTDPRPDLPVRPNIEVVAPAATDAGPPELQARLENTADHTTEVGEERDIVFAFVSSEARPGLTLLPIESDYSPVESGCWRLTDPVVVPEYYGVVSLEPGQTIGRRLGVWATPDGEACLPRGEFRFQTSYAGARDQGAAIEDPSWSGQWGFRLAVESG